MNEQIYRRSTRFGRNELVEDFLLIAQAITDTFESMTRIQFAAPWRDDGTGHDAC